MEDTAVNASSRVPPELWLVILQHAIYIDSEMLHTGTYDPFASPPYTLSPPFTWSVTDIDDIRRNISLRHNLSLVCRQWHALMSPALYETVLVPSNLSMRYLHRTLIMTAGREHLARQTRHLILAGHTSHESAGLLTALFSLMPSIETLSLLPFAATDKSGHDIVWPADVSRVLGATCGASLLKMNLFDDARVFFAGSKDVLHEFLSHTPNMRALGIQDNFLAHTLKLPRLDKLELLMAQPGLTTSFDPAPSESTAGDNERDPALPPFPSLNHFYLQASRWPSDTGFLSLQGPHITTLTLDVADLSEYSRPDIILRRIAALWTLLPSVSHVHLISLREQKLGRVFLALPPSTTHLGIWVPPPTTLTNHTSGLTLLEEQEVFLRGAPEVPAPRVVRLTNPEYARWIREEVLEGSGLGKMGPLKGRGVFRLEDHEGKVLVEVEGDGEV
ncbi:unnamed protein product [Peniophora sp. CBMAI 1063]|nr:unnamed protein product [Peniophora sp. CBMAI 1063]